MTREEVDKQRALLVTLRGDGVIVEWPEEFQPYWEFIWKQWASVASNRGRVHIKITKLGEGAITSIDNLPTGIAK
jgi:hypothetical protein